MDGSIPARLARAARGAAAQAVARLAPSLERDLAASAPEAEAVAAHFGGRVLWEGAAPAFAEPLTVLAFVNRSGSNLLGGYLADLPGLKGFGEALNLSSIRAWADRSGARSFPDYLRFHAERGGPGALGVKAVRAQLAMLLAWRMDRMFSGLRVVHIRREDALAQAVSLLIAAETGRWTHRHRGAPGAAPAYDFGRLCRVMDDIGRANAGLALTAEAAGLPRLVVGYEALVADPLAELGRVARWAGLPPPEALPAPRVEKQESALSEEFRRRFLADLARRGGFAPGGEGG